MLGMSKIFRAWKIDQPLFLPPSVQDFVAEDHLARNHFLSGAGDLDSAMARVGLAAKKRAALPVIWIRLSRQ